jgi:uncharacterized membrane protein YoaK (UPF0700 family)
MSGNTTQLAVAAGRGVWQESGTAGELIASFLFGVMIGRLLSRLTGRWCRASVLAVQAVLLAAAAFPVVPLSIATGTMALAMGLQNAVIHRAGGVKTSLTYVTGTLVSFGEKLTDALLRIESAPAFMPELGLWFGFVVGAATGAWLFGQLEIKALAIPAAAAAALSIATASLTWIGTD